MILKLNVCIPYIKITDQYFFPNYPPLLNCAPLKNQYETLLVIYLFLKIFKLEVWLADMGLLPSEN